MNAAAEPVDRPKIAVVGDTAVDYYLMLPRRQSGDEKRTATSSLRLPGGTGANAAAAAAALGSQVTLYSAIGSDRLGVWLVESLTARGVSTEHVRTFAGTTTQAIILLDADRRQVIVDRGVADRLDELDLRQIALADTVYVTGSSAAISRIAEAGTGGRLVAGIEATMSGNTRLASVLGKLDLIITNSAGWTVFAGNATDTVVTVETRGAEGAVIHTPGRPDARVLGIRVGTVDATGAGDCFAGAVCHYLTSGLDLATACQLAVAAGALSTLAVGAQSALPTDAEVSAIAGRYPAFPARPGEFT